ncbi:MAG: DUF6476 family protein [Hyphomicrobiaceae bacterium]
MNGDDEDTRLRLSMFLPKPDDAPGLRGMKWAVIVMGVILIVGFMAIVARIVYLTSRMGASGPLPAEATLNLPAGTVIRSMSLDGQRLAIETDAVGSSPPAIIIYDIGSGRVLSQIRLERGGVTTAPSGR